MTKFSHVQRVPEWTSSLVNLQLLRLEVTEFRQKDLCILGSLPVLLILEVTGMEQRMNPSRDKPLPRFIVSSTVGFPCLRKFSLGICRSIVFEAGSMPKLEKLEMWFHVNEIKCVTALNFGIGNLPCLINLKYSTFGWDTSSQLSAAQAAMERAAGTHPNRPTLTRIRTSP